MFVCPECGTAHAAAGTCPADGAPLQPIGEDALLGSTIGVYRVSRLLGIGGMGRVYKGVHPSIGSRVAIKVLSRECSDRKDLVERFFAEARAVNLIRHESIVNVLDLASLPDGRPYIIMEYLDGSPLSSVLDHARAHNVYLPLGGMARLAAEVLDALAAAHAKGIVHRDLKPDNIYVTPNGRAKVLDFGIAKLSDTSGTATRTGSLLGTPQYMSPEQCEGKPVDQRADLYAMGVILYECATNTRPFESEALFDLLRQHVQEPPPPPRTRRADLPENLEHVILAALAKSPDHRFSNAEAMSVALQQATAGLPQPQWAPITGGVRASMSGWSPTPPQSWARSAASQPQPSQPPSAPTPAPTPAPIPAPSVPTTSTRGSKTGLYLGLGGLALVGGGIVAAAVLLGRGDDAPTPPAPSAPGSAAPAGSATPGSATVETAKPAEPAKPDKPTKPGKAEDDDDGGDAEDPSDAIAAALAGEDIDVDALRAQAEKMLAKLPPAERAQYKELLELEKLPAAQRSKKLAEITAKLAGKPAPGTGSPGKGAWPTEHALTGFPFDPARVDLGTYLTWALAESKKAVPDAALTRIELEGVKADGTADLTLAIGAKDHGELELRFVSPPRTKRDPSVPLGVKVDWQCEFRIEASPEKIDLRPLNGWECKESTVPVPRCTAAALWKKAIARNKKLAGLNAVATLSYYGFNGGKPYWYFSIQDTYSERFDDDC